MANLIERAKNILLTPRNEWPVIAAESETTAGLYTRYILILAAIPVIAGFIKMSIIGSGVPFTGVTVRVGIGAGIASMVVQYGLSLLGVFLLSLIVNALAPSFGGQKASVQSLKLVAYAYTAAWVAGIAVLLPWVGWLLGLAGGIYSIYLMYLGLPATMRAPEDKAAGYTAVTVLCAIVLGIVIATIGAAISGAATVGAMSAGSGVEISTDEGTVKIDQGSLGKLEQMARNMEAAGKQMEEAQKSGDSAAQQAALGQAMGAMFGGGEQVEALKPEQLKPFVPETLAGMSRNSYNVERNTMMGLQIASGRASYRSESGEQSLDLEITDMGSAKGLAMMAGWALAESESESDQGYERVYQQDGARVHEKWDSSSKSATYDLIVAERFLVKLQGRGLEMDAIKKAAASLDVQGLAKLKGEGVKPG